jgi:hypothetical protein
MRILKVLLVIFGLLQIIPNALAQSEFTEPKFSVGYSLGLPSSLHLFIRDIGIQGLGIRADVGGITIIILGYFQAALNLEYYLSPVGSDGFYFGVGVATLQGFYVGLDASSISAPWRLAVQGYFGFEQGQYFYEAGVMAFLDGGFWFHFAVGYHFVF